MAEDRLLELGRAAFERHDWDAAYAQLAGADERSALAGEDLERWATSAFLVGNDDECIALMSRANREATLRGDFIAAGRSAFWIAFNLLNRGEVAQANGWRARGRSALAEAGTDCSVHGFFTAMDAVQALYAGDASRAEELFAEVYECGRRYDEPDLLALGRLGTGQALALRGEVRSGMSLLDEAMVAVMAGEVSPVVAGLVYCAVIDACQMTFDVGRAREWTSALTSWCEAQPGLVPYRGQCLVHRAQIMRMRGELDGALTEARGAARALAVPAGNPAQGAALYQLAEVRRVRGELVAAEEAYAQAGGWGHETQPGMALLRLAQGQAEGALAGIRRALEEAKAPFTRPPLLAAYTEIALAADDVEAARTASDELGQLAETFGAPFLLALGAHASSAVALAEGDPPRALAQARRAWATWQKLEIPYEGARSRVLLGLASRQLGDLDTAEVELRAARSVFERLGARVDLNRLEKVDAPSVGSASGLSPRELEVLRLIASGKSNRAIAADLVLSEKTVARHIANIFTKLDLSSRSAATAYAFQHDLV